MTEKEMTASDWMKLHGKKKMKRKMSKVMNTILETRLGNRIYQIHHYVASDKYALIEIDLRNDEEKEIIVSDCLVLVFNYYSNEVYRKIITKEEKDERNKTNK